MVIRLLDAKNPVIVGSGVFRKKEVRRICETKGLHGLVEMCCPSQKIILKRYYVMNGEKYHVGDEIPWHLYQHMQFFINYSVKPPQNQVGTKTVSWHKNCELAQKL